MKISRENSQFPQLSGRIDRPVSCYYEDGISFFFFLQMVFLKS